MSVTHEGPRSPSQEPISVNQSGLREDINKQEQLVDGKGPGVSPVRLAGADTLSNPCTEVP